jgi:signal transduction histidine kinase
MGNGSAPGGERSKRTRAGAPSSTPRRKRDAASSPKNPQKQGRDPLLAAICHDLRAPLAAVTMGANFVLQTTPRDGANGRSVKILEAMLRSCTQMERLIRNFADLSEIESNAVSLRLGLHDAGEMIELAAEAAGEAARARSVTIEVIKPETPLSLECDRERLLRAIGHVVENAVKQAPEGSTVTLSVAMRHASLAFAVVDRGPGLSPQVRRNLFDRQWHAKQANRVGAGFGLAIARGFAVAHGGRILVDSRPAEATTFTLLVPKTAGEGVDGLRQ